MANSRFRAGAISAAIVAAGSPDSAALARCNSALPGATAISPRSIRPDDLARLRDIGPVAPVMFLGESPFAVSPDGKSLAFQLRQADPLTNRYCLAMVVLNTQGLPAPRIVDRGGKMIRFRFRRGSLSDYYAGDAKLIVPRWSSDGRYIAFLKQVGTTVQVWLAKADGSGSHQLTHAPVHVEDFTWGADGRSIIIRTRPHLAESRAAIQEEGLTGFHYDDRWSPVASNHPWPDKPGEPRYDRVWLSGVVRAASTADRALIEKPLGPDTPDASYAPDSEWMTRGNRRFAWIHSAGEDARRSQGQIFTRQDSEPAKACPHEACSGRIVGLGWDKRAHRYWFLRREGWAFSELSLYSWAGDSDAPRRLLQTRDLIAGCTALGGSLVCALEQSNRPRRVVAIDLGDGAFREIFDPNPAFKLLRLGRVERLKWENERGIPIFGDLVLPPDWIAGNGALPLVIVQYQTRGFLRGGTDDEFPIFSFAALGFAVLSIERPAYPADQVGAKTVEERYRINEADWADKRSVLSAFAAGIDLLEKRGLVDRAHIGITGLSDGATSGQFALASSNLFAAASLTACCEEPNTLLPLLGNNGTAHLRRRGFPAFSDRAETFWSAYSMARNAARIKTPLLLQSSDDEYQLALETYASFREHGVPIELFVFPGEHHNKWQPAHRLAVYRRNLAWFSFWLKGDASPFGVPDEISRWKEMRAAQKLHGAP